MPIEFRCTACGQTLRVGDQFTGQNAKCPQCGHLSKVPQASLGTDPQGGFASPLPSAAANAPPREEGTSDQWRMKSRTGDTFGPVPRWQLNQWMTEGRIDAATQIQQEGWTGWKPASEIFPSLAANPYASSAGGRPPAVGPAGSYAYVKPHRGTLILIMGIVSIVMCAVTGPIAWMMGSADLREIREGRMDKEGEGTTQAGYVCGIIGSILLAFQLLIFLVYMLFVIGIIVAAASK